LQTEIIVRAVQFHTHTHTQRQTATKTGGCGCDGKDRRIADVEQAPHLRVLHDALCDSASCRSQVAVLSSCNSGLLGLLGLVRTGRARVGNLQSSRATAAGACRR
jgi:hypothetical protein